MVNEMCFKLNMLIYSNLTAMATKMNYPVFCMLRKTYLEKQGRYKSDASILLTIYFNILYLSEVHACYII